MSYLKIRKLIPLWKYRIYEIRMILYLGESAILSDPVYCSNGVWYRWRVTRPIDILMVGNVQFSRDFIPVCFQFGFRKSRSESFVTKVKCNTLKGRVYHSLCELKSRAVFPLCEHTVKGTDSISGQVGKLVGYSRQRRFVIFLPIFGFL